MNSDHTDTDSTTGSVVNRRQEEGSLDYEKKAKKLDLYVPGDDATQFQEKLKTFGIDGRVLGPAVGAWCGLGSSQTDPKTRRSGKKVNFGGFEPPSGLSMA